MCGVADCSKTSLGFQSLELVIEIGINIRNSSSVGTLDSKNIFVPRIFKGIVSSSFITIFRSLSLSEGLFQ